MKKGISTIVFLALMSICVEGQPYEADWRSLDKRPIPEWFEEARFGIFIHWGIYSVPAYRPLEPGRYASYAEWYYARVYNNEASGGKAFHDENFGEDFEYRQFAPLFKAELWDPVQWARIFRQSGAKYVVLTSKHHDGYCLWPTESPYKKDWNAMDVGPHRDLVGELTEAVKKEGLKMGLYYSIIEWESSKTNRTNSGYFIPIDLVEKYRIPEDKYVDDHLIPQLKELVINYQPSLIFADGGEWDESDKYWKTKEFLAWLYNESPVKDEVVVNDRFAKGMPGRHGDYYSSEYKDAKIDHMHPWEESRGIGGSYGYNRAENLEDYSTSAELIHELIDIVSRGGNFLLNVGPTADGRIPVIMQERLQDIGNWLQVNGEAIYGCRASVFSTVNEDEKLRFTQKGNTTYAFFTAWPEEKLAITIPDGVNIREVSMVGVNSDITWNIRESVMMVYPPHLTIRQLPCLKAWTLKIDTY
jgi:alpha-L-fucosidase